jgi:hypothetical protein
MGGKPRVDLSLVKALTESHHQDEVTDSYIEGDSGRVL